MFLNISTETIDGWNFDAIPLCVSKRYEPPREWEDMQSTTNSTSR